MPPEPALRDRVFDTGAVFGRGASSAEERVVDQLDMDAAILHRLGCVGDLHQLVRRRVGIGERAGGDELRAAAASSSFASPRATIFNASSGKGRCSAFASSHGARSSPFVKITGVAFEWIGSTVAFGAVG
jgi:hypothetical protein